MQGNATFPASCVLVFGSAVYRGGDPGPAMQRRMSTALKLYQQNKVQRLLLSGGRVSTTDLTEADVMKNMALEAGVALDALILESQARSTWENLVFSRALAEKNCENTVAVSDSYHVGRIRLLALRQGWELTTFPSQARPPGGIFIRNIFREILGILYYGLFIDAVYPLAPGNL